MPPRCRHDAAGLRGLCVWVVGRLERGVRAWDRVLAHGDRALADGGTQVVPVELPVPVLVPEVDEVSVVPDEVPGMPVVVVVVSGMPVLSGGGSGSHCCVSWLQVWVS